MRAHRVANLAVLVEDDEVTHILDPHRWAGDKAVAIVQTVLLGAGRTILRSVLDVPDGLSPEELLVWVDMVGVGNIPTKVDKHGVVTRAISGVGSRVPVLTLRGPSTY